jgi:hypothetical protein
MTWPAALAAGLFAVVVALAAGLPAAASSTGTLAPARPSPSVGVTFDQIDRTLVSPATPPPPGSFAIELELIKKHQAIAKNGQTTPAAHGESITDTLASIAASQIPMPFVGSWIASLGSHAQERKAEQAASEMRNVMNAGVLTRYAFYNGWTRVEVPGEYAIITRPDLGKKYTLDLQNKLFSTTAYGTAIAGSKTLTAQSTAQVQTTAAWSLKDPLVLDGHTTTHYEGTAMLLVSEARGVCEDGETRESVTEYVTDMPEPAPLAGGLESLALPAGCAPTIEHQSSGEDPSARLYLYRLIRVDGEAAYVDGPSIAVSMRSNVKPLGPDDASLFAPPPDFAAAH